MRFFCCSRPRVKSLFKTSATIVEALVGGIYDINRFKYLHRSNWAERCISTISVTQCYREETTQPRSTVMADICTMTTGICIMILKRVETPKKQSWANKSNSIETVQSFSSRSLFVLIYMNEITDTRWNSDWDSRRLKQQEQNTSRSVQLQVEKICLGHPWFNWKILIINIYIYIIHLYIGMEVVCMCV